MPVPATGPVSFLDIQNEYGGSGPIGLNEYYRGGLYVPNPAPTSPYQTAPISASGTISVGMFRGTTDIFPFTMARYNIAVDRITYYRLYSDGQIAYRGGSSWDSFYWGHIFRLPVSMVGATFSLSYDVPAGLRGPGAIGIEKTPTQAEPWLDFVVNDDGPPGAAHFLLNVNVSGAVANPPYLGPLRDGAQGDKKASFYGFWASDQTPPP